MTNDERLAIAAEIHAAWVLAREDTAPPGGEFHVDAGASADDEQAYYEALVAAGVLPGGESDDDRR